MEERSNPTAEGLEQVLDDYSRKQVPEKEGRSYVELTLIFLGISIAIPSFLLGSALVAGLGLRKATEVILWGSAIATPICILAAHVGARSRLSTAMVLRFAFGSSGAKLISAIIAVDMFCWFAVNTEIFGTSIQYSALSIAGTSLNKPLLCVLAGGLMTAITIFGYRSVEKVAVISVPLLVVLLFGYVIYALIRNPLAQVWSRPALTDVMSYSTGVSIVAGTFLSVSVLLPDFTRYAKSAGHSATAVILGLFLGLPPFVLMGAYLTAATGEEDFIRVMLLQGWGLAAIAVIALTCWAHMNATLYSASLNLAAIVRRTAKWKLTALAGLAGTVVALIGIISRYVPFLVLLSIVLPPIAGVYTADYTLRRKLYTAGRLDGLGRVHASAVLAWLAGVLIGYMTADSREMGLGWFSLTHLPAIDSYLTSFVLHWGLLRAAQTIWQRSAEPVTESQ